MKKSNLLLLMLVGALFVFNSCLKDLETVPLDEDVTTSADLFDDPEAYEAILAKLYAGLAISGQEGPAGDADIGGIDEGFGQYLRGYFYHQILPTDEAVIGWDDQTLRDFNYHLWGSSDVFVTAMYSRIFYQISACNEFVRETTDEKLDERGVTGSLRDDIEHFRAEARFLRALSYWHALDLFANVPFVTEEDAVGAFHPEQINRSDLFDYIEEELLDIENKIIAPRANEYGRADRGAVWTLLAKLYLNAEVYTGQDRYNDVITYTEKIIDEAYSLEPNYEHLFLADNEYLDEVIFAIRYHGINTRTYGGTTFIIMASIGGDMSPSDLGVNEGWGGLRTTGPFYDLFDNESDPRGMFFTDGQQKEIEDISDFAHGFAVQKFKNIDRNGDPGSYGSFVDTDFPMFRLADVYLMYAEAHLRGGGGNITTALGYINELRDRAYGDNSENITSGQLTLDFILDERGRELYWECHRRTDLIRFDKFTGGNYVWPWKGEDATGLSTNERYDLFPIPDSDITANPNLTQNDGY